MYCVVLYGLLLLLVCERLRVIVCAIVLMRFVCALSCDVVCFFVCVIACFVV